MTLSAAALLSLAVSLSGAQATAPSDRVVPPRTAEKPLRVFAASSLIDVLPLLRRAWEDAGGRPLEITFDASSRLATQIAHGAPADVFVSADRTWTAWLADRGRTEVGGESMIATNRLVVFARSGVTPARAAPGSSRASVGPPGSLAELAGGNASLALAGENVPAGRYAEAALRNAGVWDAVRPRVVRGGSALSVVEWVRRGEVDLGVAYSTDAARSDEIESLFALDSTLHPPVEYAAVVVQGGSPDGRAFLTFLGSAEATGWFAAAGFGPPAVSGPSPALPASQTRSGAPASREDPASAIRLSLMVALLSTLLAAGPAVAMGWLLSRRTFRGKAVVSTVVLAPLVLPPVVTGYLLLSFLGRDGWGGRVLRSVGVEVPFTLVGAVLAATVVGFPLFVLAARAAFDGVDRRYEEVAQSLGRSPVGSFFSVALPLARSGILAGAVLAFARALGEFGATIVLAGNLQGATRTIPLAVYTLLESPGQGRTIWVLVGASLLLSLGALVLYEHLSRSRPDVVHTVR